MKLPWEDLKTNDDSFELAMSSKVVIWGGRNILFLSPFSDIDQTIVWIKDNKKVNLIF